MDELLYKINQFRDFLEIEYAFCVELGNAKEEKRFDILLKSGTRFLIKNIIFNNA